MIRFRYVWLTASVGILLLALAISRYGVSLGRADCDTTEVTVYFSAGQWAVEPVADWYAEQAEGEPDLREIAQRNQDALDRMISIEPPPCLETYHRLLTDKQRMETDAFEAAEHGEWEKARSLFAISEAFFQASIAELDATALAYGW